MKVDVYNREWVAYEEGTPDRVIISITSSDDWPVELRGNWGDVLRLEFHDVIKVMHGCTAFCTGDADAIHAFIEKHPDKDFVIHCAAGLSRSVAVGSFMAEIHGADVTYHQSDNDDIANSRVRRGLMQKYRRQMFKSQGSMDPVE